MFWGWGRLWRDDDLSWSFPHFLKRWWSEVIFPTFFGKMMIWGDLSHLLCRSSNRLYFLRPLGGIRRGTFCWVFPPHVIIIIAITLFLGPWGVLTEDLFYFLRCTRPLLLRPQEFHLLFHQCGGEEFPLLIQRPPSPLSSQVYQECPKSPQILPLRTQIAKNIPEHPQIFPP